MTLLFTNYSFFLPKTQNFFLSRGQLTLETIKVLLEECFVIFKVERLCNLIFYTSVIKEPSWEKTFILKSCNVEKC